MGSLLEVRDLDISFVSFKGELRVLNKMCFAVGQEERVGLVGETGCGKSTPVRAILRVLPIPPARIRGGEILYRGKDILRMTPAEIRLIRRAEVSAIFQDPLAALNPVFTVGSQLRTVVRHSLRSVVGKRLTRREITARCIEALRETGMPDPERIMSNYPVQLSGGMRQRVCIAEALCSSAKLLLADEPTTNLDVTIQDQILRKLGELVEGQQMSVLLISHSLGVVGEITNRVYIVYAGTIMEEGNTMKVFGQPLHPYTQGLLASLPKLTGGGVSSGIPGNIPDYLKPPSGCRFQPRCECAMPVCEGEAPPLFNAADGRRVACFLYQG